MSLDQAIIGRDAELALLADAVDRAPTGDRLLVLTGADPRTPGWPLIGPFLGDAGRLPGRQRAALLGAVGLGPAPERSDPMLVGVAVLTLLSDLADRAPVLIAVDDAQWIDGASLDAMAFAARRLDTEPVTVIVATRGGSPLPGFATDRVLELDPLDEAAAGRLLDAQPGELSGRLRRRILQQAGGNPLALVELARAAASDRVGLDAALAGPLPLTERLERIFARALAGLPEAARRSLLLLAAADDADPASGVAMALPDTDDEAWSPPRTPGWCGRSTGGSGSTTR
ncbi:hypothetical protein [Actinomadura madurae]|uniref:hypothetical protein n=1 Tax=Actinomadura madurae TaxID=1993 RepID=UPI0020D21E4B|nr:hypothetical protein [Actinomadura madurae]MCQ0018124.1 hypothetical protein [Actinomadura madurae]